MWGMKRTRRRMEKDGHQGKEDTASCFWCQGSFVSFSQYEVRNFLRSICTFYQVELNKKYTLPRENNCAINEAQQKTHNTIVRDPPKNMQKDTKIGYFGWSSLDTIKRSVLLFV